MISRPGLRQARQDAKTPRKCFCFPGVLASWRSWREVLQTSITAVVLIVTSVGATKPTTPQPPPVIYSDFSAVQPGGSIDITWRGETIGNPISLWTSFPAQ